MSKKETYNLWVRCMNCGTVNMVTVERAVPWTCSGPLGCTYCGCLLGASSSEWTRPPKEVTKDDD